MSSKKSYAYIEITFSPKTKKYFSELVKKLVPENELYYSKDEGYSYISGDVTGNLHSTLFFGIEPATINDKKLLSIIDHSDFKEVALGDLVLFNGWQNQYKILCVELLDKDGRFAEFAKKVSEFVNDKNIIYESRPHISLAYVKQDYLIPKILFKMESKLKSDKVQISIQQ
ncbi:hypothetical protein M1563_02105 [Patescibacteria group bacterium]|nr:hypothetical protein [Patescibacteria group bacterium]MCL5410093.1 hypothetical protein [Patescibacteria group bacterium]